MPTVSDHYAPLRDALGREYRIEQVLEETEAGAAYLAYDCALHRRVVVKAIDPSLAGEREAEQFGREARVLAGLSHPSIPSVHHARAYGQFRVVVLEHSGSETLDAQLRQGPFPPGEVRRLGVQLLGALEAVHASGLAHQDVTAKKVVVADGRYVLDGFASAGPAAEGAALSDLHAVGRLLTEAAGGRPPRRLRPVLARALSLDPAGGWRSATEFRVALEKAGRRTVPSRSLRRAGLGIFLGAGVIYGVVRLTPAPPPPGPPPRELAILPFEVEGGQPLDPLGSNLAHLIQLNLDNVPGLGLTPRGRLDQWWESHGRDALGFEATAAARALRAHWVAHGLVVRRPGDVLLVRLSLYDSLGAKDPIDDVFGSANDLAALGDSITLQIIRVVAPRPDSPYEPVAGFVGVPLAALKAFLRGEAAFAQDAWALAQQYYEIALRADSTFALAEWRLANVKHWRRLPYTFDLGSVYRRHASRLRPHDRRLIEALLEQDLELRFAKLDSAIRRVPADGYARLLQGEELFHRGPLVGRELDQAVSVMADAVARDSSLALAYDHLILAYTRFGRDQEARRALDLRRRVAAGARPDDLDLLPFLELVYDERFAPFRAKLRYRYIAWRKDPPQLAGIEQVARMGTPWLDMPHTQLRYCDLLLRAGKPSVETHATAHEGKGLALFALGRPTQALAEIDSATVLLDSPEARLQQAEWRVIPPALGLLKVEDGEGRRRLEELAADSTVGARAAWALALAHLAEGDTVEARRWTERLAPGTPLRALLEAGQAAARGDLALALARSDSARLAFQVTRPPDAFAGAVFHLLRGEWLAASGDRARADGEWLWYEASDVEGWPQGAAQAGEVDAALGVFARLKRARAARVPGATADDTARACVHLRRIAELWADPEPSMSPLVEEANALLDRCPR